MSELIAKICLVAVLGTAIYLISKVYYTYYISPLSKIPNAGLLAPISRLLWAFPSEHQGRITLDLPILHAKYGIEVLVADFSGPLIRIGPKELSFYSLDIYKAINSTNTKFAKDPRVYGHFVQDDHPGLFSITDAYEHSQRRRLMGQLFNRSKMNLLEEMMTEHIASFVDGLNQRILQPVELIVACRALEADIVSAFAFGETIGAVEAWKVGDVVEMIRENDEKSKLMPILSNLPSVAAGWYRLESYIHRLAGWQTGSTSAMKDFDEWSSSQLTRLTRDEKQSETQHSNFITTMIRSRLSPQTALSEAKEMLGPGTDTTSATLAHILWGLAHDTVFQDNLVNDLEAAGWPTDMSALEAIPRLRAASKEGIRWAAAAAAMLPRVVPDGGVTFAGKFIPGGTVMTSSPIWYLHNQVAFPSPEIYDPIRWLESDHENPSERTLRNHYYIPFSLGSSSCIGAHFAYLELYLSVSQILRSFRLMLPQSNTVFPAKEAVLPQRLEWVAAVPTVPLEVQFYVR